MFIMHVFYIFTFVLVHCSWARLTWKNATEIKLLLLLLSSLSIHGVRNPADCCLARSKNPGVRIIPGIRSWQSEPVRQPVGSCSLSLCSDEVRLCKIWHLSWLCFVRVRVDMKVKMCHLNIRWPKLLHWRSVYLYKQKIIHSQSKKSKISTQRHRKFSILV